LRGARPRAPGPVALLYFAAPAPTDFYPLSLHDALPICSLTRLRLRLKRLRTSIARTDLGSDAVQRLLVRHHQAFWREGELRVARSEEHTSELQSRSDLVCRLLLEKKKQASNTNSASWRQ